MLARADSPPPPLEDFSHIYSAPKHNDKIIEEPPTKPLVKTTSDSLLTLEPKQKETKKKETPLFAAGFLNQPPKKKDTITTIKKREPKPPSMISDIQKVTEKFASKKDEWLTGSLLDRLSENENLSAHLQDPRFAKALAAGNIPTEGEDDNFRAAVQDFARILGDEFQKL